MRDEPVDSAVDELLGDRYVVELARVLTGHRSNSLTEEAVGHAHDVRLVDDGQVLQRPKSSVN